MRQRGNGGAHSFVLFAGKCKSQDNWAFNLTLTRILMILYNISVIFGKEKNCILLRFWWGLKSLYAGVEHRTDIQRLHIPKSPFGGLRSNNPLVRGTAERSEHI